MNTIIKNKVVNSKNKNTRKSVGGFRAVVLFIVNITGVFCLSCSINPEMAGTGSQAGNGRVSCTAYRPDGSYASKASVIIKPQNYLADTTGYSDLKMLIIEKQILTDDKGKFSIDSLAIGKYCIEINDGKTHAGLVKFAIVNSTENIVLPHDTIWPYAKIKGHIDRTVLRSSNTYVQVYGLNRLAMVDSSGLFSIADLPPGVYDFRIVSGNPAVLPIVITSTQLISGNNDSALSIGWKYSKQLDITTTIPGATISGVVTNFPMLIRLTSANFDFNQASVDGSDILFTKSDNSRLPYEIQRWSPVNKRAEIWVRIDTVLANDSLQNIIMHWGATNVAITQSFAQSPAVFDTAQSYAGVWHLSENGNNILGGYKDATVNANNGSGSVKMQGSSQEGILGLSQHFTGDSTTFIDMPCPISIQGNQSFSVSFWMNYQASDARQWLVYFGKDAELQAFHFLITANDSGQFGFWDPTGIYKDQNKFDISGVKGQWAMVTSVYDAENQVLCTYINDSMVTTDTITARANIVSSGGLHIGKKSNAKGTGFNGLLQELRMFNTVLSRDYIKLCYQTQKENAIFVNK